MRWVERATGKPNRCAALPQLGQDHEKGYLHLGPLDGFDNEAYASVEAIQNAARQFPQLGLIPAKEFNHAKQVIVDLERKVDDLEKQLHEADAELQAVHLLESRGRLAPTSPKPAASAANHKKA